MGPRNNKQIMFMDIMMIFVNGSHPGPGIINESLSGEGGMNVIRSDW